MGRDAQPRAILALHVHTSHASPCRHSRIVLQAVLAASAISSARADKGSESPPSQRGIGDGLKREHDSASDPLAVDETPSFNDIFG